MASSDSEEDVGPALAGNAPKRIKLDRQVLTLLDALPNATRYEKSWMHRAKLTHVVYAIQSHFLITGSEDGIVKFWKHVGGTTQLLEFVKQFQAHAKPLSSLSASADGENLCTCSAEEQTIRFFLIRTFDMSAFCNTASEAFFPSTSSWTSNELVAVACAKTPKVRIYNSAKCEVQREITSLSLKHPTICMAWLHEHRAMVSCDAGGVISYWGDGEHSTPPKTAFKYKMETDLFDLAKRKLTATGITASAGSRFAVHSDDDSVLLFDFSTGKILHRFAGAGRGTMFDSSGKLLLVPQEHCIAVYELDTFQIISQQLASAEDEEQDFLKQPMALFQGILTTDYQLERNLTGAMSTTTTVQEERKLQHPLLVCLQDERFLVFTQHEPANLEQRQVMNEKPTEAQIAKALHQQKMAKAQGLAKSAVLHTTLGDIKIELFPMECPRTVENFIGHAKRTTYCNVPFHRVIRGFMIQTGDPEGDGTGGESIWGGTFEDEISPNLRFSQQPFWVCMANRGKDTNGSQFFITVPGGAGCAHLEGKHTIFGRVVGESSQEVVKKIEFVRVDSKDRPVTDVKIVNVSVL